MGVKLDEMAEKGDSYRESFQRVNEGFIRRLINPLFWDDCIYNLFFGQACCSVLKVIHEFSSEIIAKRRILLEEELENRRATQTAPESEPESGFQEVAEEVKSRGRIFRHPHL